MHLAVIGLNHRTAPVSLREKLSIGGDQLPDVLRSLKAIDAVSECLILSTCNRTEVYACARSRADDAEIIERIGRSCGVETKDFADCLYSHAGHKAIEHVFRVAGGMDSMVVGEAQILGQVKGAYASASKLGATGTVLNALFQQAITVGKRVRSETEIGRGAFSVGSVAVQLARSIFGSLAGRTVLIVGAGKMGELALTHLTFCGADRIVVANRTYGKAVALASQFDGRPVKFEDVRSALQEADIVITSTASREPIITSAAVSRAMNVRRGKPMFFIDIAVPRNLDSGVQEIDNVFVYNIDDLQAALKADAVSRQSEVAKAEAIVAEEVDRFMDWFRALDAVPVVTALREKVEGIRRTEVEKLKKRLPDLPPEQFEAIEAATRSIVNKICHDPLVRIKEYAAEQEASSKMETVCDVFSIAPVPGDEKDEG